MPTPDLQTRLADFVSFAQSLKGDEKGEAPLFLDRLFEAFGHDGTNEAGATHEFRVSKKSGVKGKNFWVTRGDLMSAREWFGLGFTDALKSGESRKRFESQGFHWAK